MIWQAAADYTDIRYELATGEDWDPARPTVAKITIDRPEVRNAFRPETVIELIDAFERAREDPSVGVVILTGEGPLAFCSGGDQRVRGSRGGYVTGRRSLPGRPSRGRPGASTSPICTCRSGACPSRWSRWSPATRSAAAMCCTSSATSRSPLTTPASARPVRASARSTAASARACSRAWSDPRRPRRSGSSAASTTRRRRCRWGS